MFLHELAITVARARTSRRNVPTLPDGLMASWSLGVNPACSPRSNVTSERLPTLALGLLSAWRKPAIGPRSARDPPRSARVRTRNRLLRPTFVAFPNFVAFRIPQFLAACRDLAARSGNGQSDPRASVIPILVLTDDAAYEAILARDPRFDGVFFVGVQTTGVYCRPICPARTPGRSRCTFYATPAQAEQAGFRACFRCRPEVAPAAATAPASVDAIDALVAAVTQRISEGAVTPSSAARSSIEPVFSAPSEIRWVTAATSASIASTEAGALAAAGATSGRQRKHARNPACSACAGVA